MNPQGIRIQPTKEVQGILLARLGDLDMKEELINVIILIVAARYNVSQSHHINANFFIAIAALEHRTLGVERTFDDGEWRWRAHLL